MTAEASKINLTGGRYDLAMTISYKANMRIKPVFIESHHGSGIDDYCHKDKFYDLCQTETATLIHELKLSELTKHKKHASDYRRSGSGFILFTREEMRALLDEGIGAVEILFPRPKKDGKMLILHHYIHDLNPHDDEYRIEDMGAFIAKMLL